MRLFVLLLLAVLLPVRGVIAATMACPEGMPVAAACHELAHEAAEAPDAGAGDEDGSSTPVTPICAICVTGCHATPLATVAPALAGPLLLSSVAYPALRTRVPAFVPDTLERPPRLH